MTEVELIKSLQGRARNAQTRTDYASRGCPLLPGVASTACISAAELTLGFRMHDLHRRVLAEVANGGFGPGDGLIGLPGGRVDDAGHSIIELCQQLWTDAETAGLPPGVLVLCTWGDAIWSCIDSETGRVLTLNESGLTDTGQSLSSWFMDWISGVSLFGRMFRYVERRIINPFTKQMMTVQSPSDALGTPYVPRRSAGNTN